MARPAPHLRLAPGSAARRRARARPRSGAGGDRRAGRAAGRISSSTAATSSTGCAPPPDLQLALGRSTSWARSRRPSCCSATTIPGRCLRCSRRCSAGFAHALRLQGPRPKPTAGSLKCPPAMAPGSAGAGAVRAREPAGRLGSETRSDSWPSTATGCELINDVLAMGLEMARPSQRDVLLYAATCTSAARPSGSERLVHVSEIYAARVALGCLGLCSALGHIHKPQQLPGRDATAPRLADAAGLRRGGGAEVLVLVTAAPGQPAAVELVPLQAGRRVIALRGGLEQIVASADATGDALVKVIVDTGELIADLSDRVREALPDATFVDIQQALTGTKLQSLGEAELDEQEQLGGQRAVRAVPQRARHADCRGRAGARAVLLP